MSIFRAPSNRNNRHAMKNHGERVSADAAGFFDFESEVLQNDEYAWSWGMAHAFVNAFGSKFNRSVVFKAQYQVGLLGSCRHSDGGQWHIIVLRPTLRGSEAWRTLFHELAHAITPKTDDHHGEVWKKNLVLVHDFWGEFLKSLDGDLKTRLIEMVTNYGYWGGRPIGMDENTDPWNRPWAKR